MTTENQRGGSGNFADDPKRASEAGRKGAQESPKRNSPDVDDQADKKGRSASVGQQHGGSGNFANDPGRASEAGRKGGEDSHSGR